MDGFVRATNSFVPWIDQGNAAGLKIADVTGDERKTMNQRGRSDQGITFVGTVWNMQTGTA
jgi:hypothetical protein